MKQTNVSTYNVEVLANIPKPPAKQNYVAAYSIEALINIPKPQKASYISAYSIEAIINIPKPPKPLFTQTYNIEVLTPFEPLDTRTHYFAGTVKENTTSVDRVVVAYDQTSYIKVGQSTSPGGEFVLPVTTSGTCFVLCYDDAAGLDYNHLVAATVIPTTISG